MATRKTLYDDISFANWDIFHTGNKKCQDNIGNFLVRWLPQRTLVPSFFSFLSIFYLSSAIFPFTCNFMWFIKLRASAGMCGVCVGMRGCVRVCMGVRGCEWVCLGVSGCARVCVGVRKCPQVCVGMHGCAQSVRRCVWKCRGVCMGVGWIFRIPSRE